jgi:PAS domain S-box-containing protein
MSDADVRRWVSDRFSKGVMVVAQQHEAEVLLRTEHAVARVLADAGDEASAYPRLLEAICGALGWKVAAVWRPADGTTGEDQEALRCVTTWCAPLGFEAATRNLTLWPGEGLPGRVVLTGKSAWIADILADANFPRRAAAAEAGLRSAFCFPVRGTSGVLAAIELLDSEPRAPDQTLLDTMTSLASRIGQCVERWRAENRVRESEARKTAILDAAFDSIITMDAEGRVIEVNRATETVFGYRAADMVGRELAELIVPPELREAHRQGLARYVRGGEATIVGHPVELPAMRADGSTFPVEIAITRPLLPGPPQFAGYIRDVTERRQDEQALRSLVNEQAALRRVATAVASDVDEEPLFAIVTEEVGHILGAQTANMVRYEPDGGATVVGAWSTGGVDAVPLGTRVALDGATVAARILRSGRPERLDSYEGLTGSTADLLRSLGFRCAVGAPVHLGGQLWGAVLISAVEEYTFPEGAERRIADFCDLVAVALANAQARRELTASRARIVEAGDAERRRIERNLHDGAQQRLVAVALTLRRTEVELERGTTDARALLQAASAELAEALAELRELARGIHPAILSERGLVPALETIAGRYALPVELSADLDDRLPEQAEAAAYYLVAEAMTNASKHAKASSVRVEVGRDERSAVVRVADDGDGGADERRGSGLCGLRDRVEALGGTLTLESPRGRGTTITARIPLAQPAAS